MKLVITLLCTLATIASAEIKVAALHPLIGNLVRDVGGKNVEVVDLLKAGGDIHHFEPSAKDIAAMKNVRVIFASGKHIESYLDNLKDSVGAGVKIVEVGKPVPSVKIEKGQEIFMCCPEHAAGGIDPHWWHSASGMQRAVRFIGEELGAADPANAATYKANASAKEKSIAAMRSWAMQQLAQIPKSDRKLVTAHAAFGYFCKEFGFKSLPLLGLGREDEATAKYLAEAIATIRSQGIKAIFPEDQANPKIIKQIVSETGVKLGGDLIADGTAPGYTTFEAMLKHNVETIVKALKP
ncbi:MAG: metal ABC transporter substrate-binding protein [Verrucomicrobiaceae bacterium]|nr:metal ABC transporter substrate-binding protein [Verrucomicrobiaceae bacterium]